MFFYRNSPVSVINTSGKYVILCSYVYVHDVCVQLCPCSCHIMFDLPVTALLTESRDKVCSQKHVVCGD